MQLYKNNIIYYIDENQRIKKGVVVSNNACLYFSSVFQVVPFVNGKIEAKKEVLIDISQIIGVSNNLYIDTEKKLNKWIVNHHQKKCESNFKIGEVYFANIPKSFGSIQYGDRPILIVSEEIVDGKIHVIPLTTRSKKELPTHVKINSEDTFLLKDSMVLAEAEMPLDIKCIDFKLGEFSPEIMEKVLQAIKIQHGIAI